jgi:hypothetical protein
MDGWALAVDVGDTSVIAAVSQGDRTELVEFAGGQAISPAVFLAAGQPTLAGAAGLAKDASPPRNAISPKRALAAGDAAAIAGSDIPLAKAYAAIMTNVAREAARGRPSATPDRLALTHPAAWGERELGVLREAASAADLPDPLLIAEPVAAACYLATDARPGQVLAVFDLGGDSIDAAVLRRTRDGFELAGAPGGLTWLASDDPAVGLRRGAHELLATIAESGLAPAELAAILVVGAASDSGTLTRLIDQTLGVIPVVAVGPATATVLGAVKYLAAQPGRAAENVHAATPRPVQLPPRGKRVHLTASRMAVVGLAALVVAACVVAVLLTRPAGTTQSAGLKQLTGGQLAAALLPASALPPGYSDPASSSLGNGKRIIVYPPAGRLPSKNKCQGAMQPVISQLGQFMPEFSEATGFADSYSSQEASVNGLQLLLQINQAIYQFANSSQATAFFSLIRPCLLPSPATHLSRTPIEGNQAIAAVGRLQIRPSGKTLAIMPVFVLYRNDILAVSATRNSTNLEISFPEADGLIAKLIARVDKVGSRADALGPPVRQPLSVTRAANTASAISPGIHAEDAAQARHYSGQVPVGF